MKPKKKKIEEINKNKRATPDEKDGNKTIVCFYLHCRRETLKKKTNATVAN